MPPDAFDITFPPFITVVPEVITRVPKLKGIFDDSSSPIKLPVTSSSLSEMPTTASVAKSRMIGEEKNLQVGSITN